MSQQATGKKQNKFTTKMQKKLVVLFLLVLLAFAGLSARLILINKENGESYKREILSQQQYSSQTLPFKRGEIIDAKGTKLAVSEKVYNVILDTVQMSDKKEYIEPTINAMAGCFGLNASEIRTFIQENPTSRYKVWAKRLTYDEISPFLELEQDKEKGKNIQGVWFEEEYRRVYPNGELASTVLGFMSKDNVGTYGLEEYYNDTLNGTNGREYGYLNDDANLERTTKAAIDGSSIVLTIDANIQSIVERCLQEYNEEYTDSIVEGPGYKNAGCVIMDVHTGEVLAMADSSGYDGNDAHNPQKLLGRFMVNEQGTYTDELITEETLAQLEADNDALYRNLNATWNNFCISSSYEPGSVSKPFTVATGLECGAIHGNESYYCNGGLVVVEGEKPIKCHNRIGDGELTIQQGIERSCNVVMMRVGQSIGKNVFREYQSNFNFGLKTNIDLAGEARTAGLIHDANNMGPAELATYTFGQGFNVTMIEMITAFSSLINGGYYYEPHVVSKIVNSEGATIKNIEPRVLKQTVCQSTSDTIIEFCNTVVSGENGTGKTARPAGYMIGGKTGTAETLPRGNKKYVVSFMGYAPSEDPQIAIYVVVQEGNGDEQGDAKHATRIVRNILTEVLPYMNIFMTEELSEAEVAELEERQLAITQKTQETVSDNDTPDSESGESVSGNTQEDTEETPDGAESSQAGQISENRVDPETGYIINAYGDVIDPETGFIVDGSDSVLE